MNTKLNPYQVVIWNLETDPPTPRIVDLVDPRPGFIRSFNQRNADGKRIASDTLASPTAMSKEEDSPPANDSG